MIITTACFWKLFLNQLECNYLWIFIRPHYIWSSSKAFFGDYGNEEKSCLSIKHVVKHGLYYPKWNVGIGFWFLFLYILNNSSLQADKHDFMCRSNYSYSKQSTSYQFYQFYQFYESWNKMKQCLDCQVVSLVTKDSAWYRTLNVNRRYHISIWSINNFKISLTNSHDVICFITNMKTFGEITFRALN